MSTSNHMFTQKLKTLSSPSFPHIRVFMLTGCIVVLLGKSFSVPPFLQLSLRPYTPLYFPLCLLVNELVLLRAMGKENRLAPGR